jgi:hypothetical protein
MAISATSDYLQLKKNRKAHIFGHCLSSKTTPEIVDFDAAGLYGGIINNDRKPGDFQVDTRSVNRRVKADHFY